MKARRILAATLTLVVLLSVICITAISVSALTTNSDITKVYVDVPGAEAGRKTNNSPEIVTWVDNRNH